MDSQVEKNTVLCSQDLLHECFFLKPTDGRGQERVGQLNGRYAFLFKVLLCGSPIFAFLLTVFLVPFTTWVASEQYIDIANRKSNTKLAESVERLDERHIAELRTLHETIGALPPDPFERRVDRLESTQNKIEVKVETILVNQAKIMAKMGIPD